MSRSILYVAITSHGFGHAVRAASVIAWLQKLNPDILPILVTTAPRWLLESYLTGNFIYRPRAFDVGVIQSDSIQMDKVATLEKIQQIRSQQQAIIKSEVEFIQQNKVGLILADIPPLAASIAKAAGIPCWMLGNFGWDFIYRPWGGEYESVADWIAECYGQCDRLFRLPLYEPMSAFPHITDVGLTGGIPHDTRDELRQKFGLQQPSARTILLTFGGLGLQQIPYQNLDRFPDWQFISFDRQAPSLPNLIKIAEDRYRPVDFLPVCGRVISKPGYSTFAEALRQNTPIVSLTRDDFAEAPILLDGIQKYSRHQIITPDEFYGDDWDFLHQEPDRPKTAGILEKNGSETIAQSIVDYFDRG
jgi:hypothetical protein